MIGHHKDWRLLSWCFLIHGGSWTYHAKAQEVTPMGHSQEQSSSSSESFLVHPNGMMVANGSCIRCLAWSGGQCAEQRPCLLCNDTLLLPCPVPWHCYANFCIPLPNDDNGDNELHDVTSRKDPLSKIIAISLLSMFLLGLLTLSVKIIAGICGSQGRNCCVLQCAISVQCCCEWKAGRLRILPSSSQPHSNGAGNANVRRDLLCPPPPPAYGEIFPEDAGDRSLEDARRASGGCQRLMSCSTVIGQPQPPRFTTNAWPSQQSVRRSSLQPQPQQPTTTLCEQQHVLYQDIEVVLNCPTTNFDQLHHHHHHLNPQSADCVSWHSGLSISNEDQVSIRSLAIINMTHHQGDDGCHFSSPFADPQTDHHHQHEDTLPPSL